MNTSLMLKTAEVSPEELARKAEAMVAAHPHFCGRTHALQFNVEDGVLTVTGTVPSYYVKQMLQSALKNFKDVRLVDNKVAVWCEVP